MHSCIHNQNFDTSIISINITEDGGLKNLILYSQEESVTDNHQIGIKFTNNGRKKNRKQNKNHLEKLLGNVEVLKGFEICVKTLKLNEIVDIKLLLIMEMGKIEFIMVVFYHIKLK